MTDEIVKGTAVISVNDIWGVRDVEDDFDDEEELFYVSVPKGVHGIVTDEYEGEFCVKFTNGVECWLDDDDPDNYPLIDKEQ